MSPGSRCLSRRAPAVHFLHLHIFLLLLFLLDHVLICRTQSPPRLLPEAFEQGERIVPEGSSVLLSCPVEADPDTLFFEWFRDRDPLDLFADHRYRVQGNGALRIKDTIPDDTGLYSCRAVNGFGRVDINVTLIVLGSPKSSILTSENDEDLERDSEDIASDREGKPPAAEKAGKPVLRQVTPRVGRGATIQRLVGSMISLRCAARGNPKPQVSWLKNGKPLPDSNLPSSSRRGGGGPWTLDLRNLQASDTGNYTCRIYNGFGSVNATFPIKVIDRVRTKPDIVSNSPRNLTVRSGETATFQCLLVSDIPPHVQWLKQISEAEYDSGTRNTVKLLGEAFYVLRSTKVVEQKDGSFLNRLVLSSVQEWDSGKYICLGANAMGFSFRSAFLTVLPEYYSSESQSGLALPFPIVVGIAVSGIIILAGLLGLGLYCRSSRRFLPVPSSRVTTATATSSSSCGASATLSTHQAKDHCPFLPNQNLAQPSYVSMAYRPHLEPSANDEAVPARIYIPNGQLHRTVPFNSIFL